MTILWYFLFSSSSSCCVRSTCGTAVCVRVCVNANTYSPHTKGICVREDMIHMKTTDAHAHHRIIKGYKHTSLSRCILSRSLPDLCTWANTQDTANKISFFTHFWIILLYDSGMYWWIGFIFHRKNKWSLDLDLGPVFVLWAFFSSDTFNPSIKRIHAIGVQSDLEFIITQISTRLAFD